MRTVTPARITDGILRKIIGRYPRRLPSDALSEVEEFGSAEEKDQREGPQKCFKHTRIPGKRSAPTRVY